MTPPSTHHQLTFDVPSTRDYLNGGYGDHVAQCACGAYEFVASEREGAYWHGLHLSDPTARAYTLLRRLVDNPMPEGWEAPAPVVDALAPVRVVAPRAYTCPRCLGARTVDASYASIGGRFYHWGERAACSECAGTGTTDKWVA